MRTEQDMNEKSLMHYCQLRVHEIYPIVTNEVLHTESCHYKNYI